MRPRLFSEEIKLCRSNNVNSSEIMVVLQKKKKGLSSCWKKHQFVLELFWKCSIIICELDWVPIRYNIYLLLLIIHYFWSLSLLNYKIKVNVNCYKLSVEQKSSASHRKFERSHLPFLRFSSFIIILIRILEYYLLVIIIAVKHAYNFTFYQCRRS